MRANPRTRIRPATHTRAHIHIYTHVRTYTRTRRNFSDNKSALQHCQTEFHHQSDTIHFCYPITVQSISILAPPLIVPSVQTITICHLSVTHLQPSPNYPPTIQLSLAYIPFIITAFNHLARIIFHLYLISTPTIYSPFYQYVSLL